ncbi:YqgE/AlgH family protein [Chitinophaga filiformis]|uniref:YqgE/AlgH family protein n=1 Tax=Chitinophaga filiformis TaxID=104663 RepID=UPI001F1FE91B|nr:YqgE/AlgH family protein [Chitinophaga filiformis]MCF6404046.1 YqgE/AlgH family protein [Chitinophaga filiformis]
MVSLSPGMLLIADPFLKDQNFARTVVLLCEHQENKGSFGFVINKVFDQHLSDLVPEVLVNDIKIYYGGPVQIDTIHFIHQQPELINGGFEIQQGVYWGGEFDQVVSLINSGRLDLNKIKFFIGYSGWSGGQLENELNEKSWILSESNVPLVFEEKEQNIWPQALKNLGSNFAIMANFPIDPLLN